MKKLVLGIAALFLAASAYALDSSKLRLNVLFDQSGESYASSHGGMDSWAVFVRDQWNWVNTMSGYLSNDGLVGIQAVIARSQGLYPFCTKCSPETLMVGELTHAYNDRYVTQLHDKYKADVTLFMSDLSTATMGDDAAGMVLMIPASSPRLAVAIVKISALTGLHTLTPSHEIGHLFGARHENDTGSPSYARAFQLRAGNGYDSYCIDTLMRSNAENVGNPPTSHIAGGVTCWGFDLPAYILGAAPLGHVCSVGEFAATQAAYANANSVDPPVNSCNQWEATSVTTANAGTSSMTGSYDMTATCGYYNPQPPYQLITTRGVVSHNGLSNPTNATTPTNVPCSLSQAALFSSPIISVVDPNYPAITYPLGDATHNNRKVVIDYWPYLKTFKYALLYPGNKKRENK